MVTRDSRKPKSYQYLRCTLCSWFGENQVATWMGTSPSHTTHYLCQDHHSMHHRKYSNLVKLSNRMIDNILNGRGVYDRP